MAMRWIIAAALLLLARSLSEHERTAIAHGKRDLAVSSATYPYAARKELLCVSFLKAVGSMRVVERMVRVRRAVGVLRSSEGTTTCSPGTH